MSNIRFYNFNLTTRPTTDVTASSEDSFFPAINTQDPRTTKEWRSATGVLSANVIYDFKTSESVDSVLVVPNKLDGFGFTSMTIEGNITSDFSSPVFSTTLTPNFEFDFGFKTFATQSLRFWRISLTGAGSFVSLSNIFIGTSVQMTNNNIGFGWNYKENDISKRRSNRYNQLFIDKILKQKELSGLSIKLMNKTEVDQIFEIYDANGTTEPVWIIIDDSETIINDFERFSGYFYFTGSPSVTNSAFSLYDTSLSVREVI